MESAATSLLRLNLETQSHHAMADQLWAPLLAPDVTKWQYVARLALVYGFEAPLESALAYTPNLRLAIDIRSRIRAGRVAQDLITLGLSAGEVADLPQCGQMAPFSSPLEGLGWLYVSERSTLQHDAVRKNVVGKMPDIANATAYLSVYDGIVGLRWHELGAAFDRSVRTERALEEVIAGAQAGFRCLASWSGVTAQMQSRAKR
ncbi:MAG TPA: biliverdin-producing heme oxygenase [Kofleriaceae bacterium]|nr:biliverdin-producing heme oxygenase [Kofleriaceae bacterium]